MNMYVLTSISKDDYYDEDLKTDTRTFENKEDLFNYFEQMFKSEVENFFRKIVITDENNVELASFVYPYNLSYYLSNSFDLNKYNSLVDLQNIFSQLNQYLPLVKNLKIEKDITTLENRIKLISDKIIVLKDKKNQADLKRKASTIKNLEEKLEKMKKEQQA